MGSYSRQRLPCHMQDLSIALVCPQVGAYEIGPPHPLRAILISCGSVVLFERGGTYHVHHSSVTSAGWCKRILKMANV